MEWIAGIIAALGGALAMLIPILVKAFRDIRNNDRKFDRLWHGIIARGYVEAQKCGHLTRLDNGTWHIADPVKAVYGAIGKELRTLYRELKTRLNRPPTNYEYSWAIEEDPTLQIWMVENACPKLGLNQHGCLAIAFVIVSGEEETE